MKTKIFKVLKIIKYIVVLLLSRLLLLFPVYRKIWIISERGFDARDNGFHLFNYIMKQQNRPNIYYVISRDSEDANRLRNYRNIIDRGSFRHWLYFCLSEVKISTHIMGYSPDMYFFNWIDRYGMVFGKKIFLQHGVIYNDFPGLYYPTVKLDLFVCGARPEYEYVTNQFNHPPNVVKYLGLCRYDNLSNSQPENYILLMPTWRSFLNLCKSDSEFIQTEYFQKYNSLLKSKSLMEMLKKYGFKLIFYPHYEIQKYIRCFEIADNDYIIIANKEDYDVQELLKKCKILITDFSSVFFDFLYMKKPVVFYHFDKDENYRKQGYLDLTDCLFGKSCPTEYTLIETINEYLNNGCIISEEVRLEIDKYFIKNDTDNCRRNYQAIHNLL